MGKTARLRREAAVDPLGAANAIRRRCERLSIYVIPDRVVVPPGELSPRSALTAAADRGAAEHREVSAFEEPLSATLPAAALRPLWKAIPSIGTLDRSTHS